MNRRSILILSVVASAVSSAAGWRMSDERYNCFTSGMTLQELASAGVTVTSHTPATREYCEEAHRWGLKVCPYVSLYKVTDSTKDPNLLDHPFWKEVDASARPEWFLRRGDGEIRRPFDLTRYPAAFQQSCCNHRDLVDAYARGVSNVMELGADGVFVDNVHPHPQCYGPDCGLHTHDWPEKDNTECYKMALRRVYETVKSFGADRVVILNSGDPKPDFVGYGDSLMWECFVWRSPADGLFVTRDVGPPEEACRRESWADLKDAAARWGPRLREGASIAPLTYLPDPNTEAKNAFFAYACATLCGFDQWAATCNRRRDIVRRIYRIRTGQALTGIEEKDGAAFRIFEKALVLCNPTTLPVEARLKVPRRLRTSLIELSGMREVPVSRGRIALAIPPESGRILVPRPVALDNLLREVEGQAMAMLLHLEQNSRTGDASDPDERAARLREIKASAASCREQIDATGEATADLHEALCRLSTDLPERGNRTGETPDPFLEERFENLARHAALAAGLATGLFLDSATDNVPFAGDVFPVRLAVGGPGAADVASVEVALRAVLDGRELSVSSAPGAAERGTNCTVRLPSEMRQRAGLDLHASGNVTLAGGKRLVLRTRKTLTVMDPVSVAARFVQPSERPEDVTANLCLESHVPSPVSGTADLVMADEWTASPRRQDWLLPAAGCTTIAFAVTAPTGSGNVLGSGTLTLSVANGVERSLPWEIKVSPSVPGIRAATPPILDGALDDPAWKNAGTLSDFVSYQDGAPAGEPTSTCVTYDDTALYIGVRCTESKMEELKAEAVPDAAGSSAEVWRDDSVEVFVAPVPGGGQYLRFAVNCAGVRTTSADGPWRSAVAKTQTEWCVELALPYGTLGADPPKPGDTWGLNVGRNEQRLGETTCWSCTYGSFAQPDRFGWLLFR
ncbi:sugar-binding protein [Verrucomicrobiota bacterium]